MGIFNRLFSGKSSARGNSDPDGVHVYVRCDRCGEKLHIRANKRTDVTREYDEQGNSSQLMLHKEILGSRCQNLMFLHATLDSTFNIVTSQTERCTVITRAQYEAAETSISG